jgi:16S rRNA (cytidine1402-2'-O)-methyltransferase
MTIEPAGCLFVVSTPIGNLGDITRRAVEVLSQVPCVVAEDTRRTRALLSALAIANKDVRSLNAHSTAEAVAQIVGRLERGESVALVTDAGTPAVSDPGRALVQGAAAQGIPIRVVPGPSAVTAAVALSGLVEGPFVFFGFLPRRGAARQRYIERIVESPEPVVIFEAPPRLTETLHELKAKLPERQAFIGRELTKMYEEGLRGTLAELATRDDEWRGEIVLVIAAAEPSKDEDDADRRRWIDASLSAALQCGVGPGQIARALANSIGTPRGELYRRALELRAAMPEGSLANDSNASPPSAPPDDPDDA